MKVGDKVRFVKSVKLANDCKYYCDEKLVKESIYTIYNLRKVLGTDSVQLFENTTRYDFPLACFELVTEEFSYDIF